jgi:hypothetical protein
LLCEACLLHRGVWLDGYIAGPNAEFDFYPASDQMAAWVNQRYPETVPTHIQKLLGLEGAPTKVFDTLVMGRGTYESAYQIPRHDLQDQIRAPGPFAAPARSAGARPQGHRPDQPFPPPDRRPSPQRILSEPALQSHLLVQPIALGSEKRMSFQAYLDNIEDKTGLTPREFIAPAKERGFDDPSVKAATG